MENQKFKKLKSKYLVDGKVPASEFIETESSNIAGYYFNKYPGMGDFYIHFHNGSYYRYDLVPKSVVEELAASKSIGKYFFSNIRGKYKTTEVHLSLKGS